MSQHIHILGICGTFMGSLAQLAKAAGFRVTGCDKAVYPPMSTQLDAAGIELIEGFSADQLSLKPDVFVIGNVVSRGNPLMEAILNRGENYVSGPQWLSTHILRDKWVLGVAGTHGKTTTTSMLAWILEYAGFNPGFLIGGVPDNFDVSARLGESDFFVIEADEYDTAFFDKRSKFIHYGIRTLVINNLEFDHADIFPDLAAIQTQFHHLVRTVPEQGMVISPGLDSDINDIFAQGCWTDRQSSGRLGDSDSVWQYELLDDQSYNFAVYFAGQKQADVHWQLDGLHNIQNALHAIAAARHIGIDPGLACAALEAFKGVKRRMEHIGCAGGINVYDDFAHHPTAIRTTLEGLRKRVGQKKIIAVIEPRSNTMKLGIHKENLQQCTSDADSVFWYVPSDVNWPLAQYVTREDTSSRVFDNTQTLIDALVQQTNSEAHVVVMSNGGFEGMSRRLYAALGEQ